jgi:hypothetical protein
MQLLLLGKLFRMVEKSKIYIEVINYKHQGIDIHCYYVH